MGTSPIKNAGAKGTFITGTLPVVLDKRQILLEKTRKLEFYTSHQATLTFKLEKLVGDIESSREQSAAAQSQIAAGVEQSRSKVSVFATLATRFPGGENRARSH